MGKIKQGILGGVSGTVGNVVGSSWKGINYLRIKAQHFKDAKSEGQVGQRVRFAACTALAKSIFDSIIRPVWDKKAKKMSGYNLFVKTNIGNFDDNGEIADYGLLRFAVGDLVNAAGIIVADDPDLEGAIRITWSDNSGTGNAAATDRLNILAFCNGEIVVLDSLDIARSAGTAQVPLPFGAGVDVHVYAFFANEGKSKYSNDQYAFVEVN
jgi:hypothetical protein